MEYHTTCTLILKAEIAPTGSDTDQGHIITHFMGECAFGDPLLDANTGIPGKTPPQLTGKMYVHPGLLHIRR